MALEARGRIADPMLETELAPIRRLHALAATRFIPLFVLFELTHRCNLRCHHCYVAGERGKELSLEEIDRILDELAAEGALNLVLTGGEIFLREDLLDIACHAKRKHFALFLFTNGTLISPSMANRLCQLGPAEVAISIYGSKPATHDGITGVPGSFRRSVAALKLLRQGGVYTVLKCSLMKENIGEYRAIRALAEELGARPQFDPRIMPRLDGGREPTEHQCDDQPLLKVWSESREYLEAIAQMGRPNEELFQRPLCLAGRDSVAISPQGIVTPCLMLRLPAGDLRNQSFAGIWHSSSVLAKLRGMTFADLPQCIACKLAWYCTRCSALSYQEGAGLTGCSQTDRRLAQIRARVAMKGGESRGRA